MKKKTTHKKCQTEEYIYNSAYWLRNENRYLMTVRTLFGNVDNSDLTCAMLVITSSGSTTVTDSPAQCSLSHRQDLQQSQTHLKDDMV